MSQPFLGEIKLFGGNYAPEGWKFCNGDLLGIGENEALFSLLGTTYGGDGVTTFGLPDLRGRIPLSQGKSTTGKVYSLGQISGSENVTLLSDQLPAHTHPATASGLPANSNSPGDGTWGTGETKEYSSEAPSDQMNPGAVGSTGGGNPHDNMMPYLSLSFIIAIEGIYPSQN